MPGNYNFCASQRPKIYGARAQVFKSQEKGTNQDNVIYIYTVYYIRIYIYIEKIVSSLPRTFPKWCKFTFLIGL